MNTRMCAVCRERLQKQQLVRVVYEDEKFCVDQNKTKKNRAVYICNKDKCLENVFKKKLFNKAYKTNIPQETYNNFYEELSIATKNIK